MAWNECGREQLLKLNPPHEGIDLIGSAKALAQGRVRSDPGPFTLSLFAADRSQSAC